MASKSEQISTNINFLKLLQKICEKGSEWCHLNIRIDLHSMTSLWRVCRSSLTITDGIPDVPLAESPRIVTTAGTFRLDYNDYNKLSFRKIVKPDPPIQFIRWEYLKLLSKLHTCQNYYETYTKYMKGDAIALIYVFVAVNVWLFSYICCNSIYWHVCNALLWLNTESDLCVWPSFSPTQN